MSSLAEYRSWLVVEAADGFGMAAVTAKLLGDIGCTIARLDRQRVTADVAKGARVPAAAFVDDGDDADARASELVSRGKHSVGIDYTDPTAIPALDSLLRAANVLVVDREGLRQLQATLQTDDLRQRYPQLTVCSCTAFGLDGPLAAWSGGEEIVQAVSGIMSITGHPGSGPTRIAGAPLTHAAAMFAVTSIVADALGKRAGEPASLLDACVYDAAIAFHSASLPAYWLSGAAPAPIGNRHSMAAPWNSFRCADGWAIICAGNHPNWVRLCETIGRPDLLSDPRYATPGDRVANVETIEAEVTAWTQTRTVAEVEDLLNAGTIACGSVLSLADVIAHPQFAARGLMSARDSSRRQAGGVFNLDREPLDVCEAPWRPGAGTRTVLVDCCHVRRADYERWLAAGAVFEAMSADETEETADAEAA